MFVGEEFDAAFYWKSVVAVAPGAIDPNAAKPVNLFIPALRAAFYTPAAYQLA